MTSTRDFVGTHPPKFWSLPSRISTTAGGSMLPLLFLGGFAVAVALGYYLSVA